MPLCRVFYREDGKVSISYPSTKFHKEGETEQQTLTRYCDTILTKEIPALTGLPFDDIDSSELPQDAQGNKVDRDKWRKKSGGGVKIDHSVVTLAEKRKAIEVALDSEIIKPNSDTVKVIELNRKLQTKQYD